MTTRRCLGAKFTPNPFWALFCAGAKLCQNSFNRNFCGNISRQWRAFLLSEIFHELFRVYMRIKVNILTRRVGLIMTQGEKTFGLLPTLGVQRHMSFHSHNFVVQDTRWASSVGSFSREHTVRVVLAHSVNC